MSLLHDTIEYLESHEIFYVPYMQVVTNETPYERIFTVEESEFLMIRQESIADQIKKNHQTRTARYRLHVRNIP